MYNVFWKGYFPKEGMLSGAAGDLLFGVLDASCSALGFRMFYSRDILSKNLVRIVQKQYMAPTLVAFLLRVK